MRHCNRETAERRNYRTPKLPNAETTERRNCRTPEDARGEVKRGVIRGEAGERKLRDAKTKEPGDSGLFSFLRQLLMPMSAVLR